MKKLLLLVVILASAGAFLAWPYLAADALVDALRRGDEAQVAERVDLPALRSAVSARLADRAAQTAGGTGSLFGDLLRTLAGHVGEAVADGLVTPGHLVTLLGGSGADAPVAKVTMGWEGPDRFAIDAEGDPDAPYVLVLSREGLAWRLVDLRRPGEPETPPTPAPSETAPDDAAEGR